MRLSPLVPLSTRSQRATVLAIATLAFMLGVTVPRARAEAVIARVSFVVSSDPGGHRPFIESERPMPSQLDVSTTDGAITIGGAAPFVAVTGTIDASGAFTTTGTGTVAEFPGTAVRFTGTFAGGVLTGTYTLGTNGALPGGQPIAYAVTPAASATFVVNAADDGADGTCDAAHCSLREAIIAANARPGTDTITFALGSGPITLRPLTALPAITGAVTIDGSGVDGTPRVEVDGSAAGAGATGLVLSGGDSLIRGLVVNRFAGPGISATGAGRYTVSRTVLGTDPKATLDLGNGGAGLTASGDVKISIDRSTVAFNGAGGITVDATTGAVDLTLTGNAIKQNRLHGVRTTVSVGGTVTVGGPSAADGNTVTGEMDLGASIEVSGPIALTLDVRHNAITGGRALRVTQDTTATLTLTTGNNALTGSLLGADFELSGNATVTMSGDSFTGGASSGLRVLASPPSGRRVRLTLDGVAGAGAGSSGVSVLSSGAGTLDLAVLRTTLSRAGGDAMRLEVTGTADVSVRATGSAFETSAGAGLGLSAARGRLRLDLAGKGNIFRGNAHGVRASGRSVEVGVNLGLAFFTADPHMRAAALVGVNEFSANSIAGLLAEESAVVRLTGDPISRNGVGVIARTGAALTLEGVTVTASTGAGVEVRDTSNASIARSSITGNGGEGVRADATAAVALEGNTVEGNGLGAPLPVDFTGTLAPSGVSLIVLRGTALASDVAAATRGTSLWVAVEGRLVGHVVGAPAFVNEAFPAPLASGTIVLVIR